MREIDGVEEREKFFGGYKHRIWYSDGSKSRWIDGHYVYACGRMAYGSLELPPTRLFRGPW